MGHLEELVDDYLGNSEQPEEEAINLYVHLAAKFGWTGVNFTRSDAEMAAGGGREFTEDEWDAVRETKYWSDMGSVLTESGAWELVDLAIGEAGIAADDDD